MTRTPRLLLVGSALTAAAALILTGCGPSSSSSAPRSQPSANQNGQGGPGNGQFGNRTTGKIAEIDGKTFQVQTRDAQTAVTYTSKTTFTRQASAKASAVVKGVCVNVRSAAAGSSAGATPQVSAPSQVTATSVAIVAANSDGACGGMGGGMGPGGGTPPAGAPSGMPSGAPSGMPSGMPSGGPGGMGGVRPVFGTVASVSDSGFTVTSQGFGSAGTQTVTVTTTADTTYTQQEKASAGDAKVGSCLTATGKADSTGAVAATAIALSAAVNGECAAGFGRGR